MSDALDSYTSTLKECGRAAACQCLAGYYDWCSMETWCFRINNWPLQEGEAGIALLDLYFVSDLPLLGEEYEEFVLSNGVLFEGVPIKGTCAPTSFNELFEIYQLLYSESQPSTGGVHFEAWRDYFHGNIQEGEDVGSTTSWENESQQAEAIKAVTKTEEAMYLKLAEPRLLSEDEDAMKLLLLKKKTQSFFDKLEVIFGWREGVCPYFTKKSMPCPLVLGLRMILVLARGQASRVPKPSAPIKPKSDPPKEREDNERERKRKRGRESSLIFASRERKIFEKGGLALHDGVLDVVPCEEGRGSRSPAPRVEVSTSSTACTRLTYPACPTASVLTVSKATQKEMGASRVCPSGSSVVQSSGTHAS
ncbi:hypothetical protein AMTR_s00026p00103840 [Amborella trichopoda]|uniref:Uncharacterized protein n=1 Tax=Amborella trichopoda TaxID=13333 RepID=W1PSX1_AMBTC|nr:hypothetical protein AMTR_s00026p00103840 [Amborella trichopoda]